MALTGCVGGPVERRPIPRIDAAPSAVVPVSHAEPAVPDGPLTVDAVVQLAVARNPRLSKAAFAIDAARGKYTQAGLYPNPSVDITGDELGDRTGTGGIWTTPRASQEIVTGHKLSLSQAVVAKEVDQATLALLRERYELIGEVRAAYYDAYALERKVAVLDELVRVADGAIRTGRTLLDNKQIARLDLVQLEVTQARYRAQAESARRELPAARRRLAAVVGDPRLAVGKAVGPFDRVPAYDPEQTLDAVLASHPDVRTARVAVDRAQAAVRRAEAEPIPNLTLSTGYTRQNQNKSSDWLVGVSTTVPVWNRNQGAIRAAKAELGMAVQDVGRAENDLAERTASAGRAYAAAVELAERYQADVLPKADETFRLSMEAFSGGQFEYLRVVQAQEAAAEARLDYVKALGDAWQAAAKLSALLLEEGWPGPAADDAVQPR